MPDEDMLRQMYGPEYERSFASSEGQCDPKEPQRVIDWLEKHDRGTFVDYGCGDGSLLAKAMGCGWAAIGVELDREVAAAAEKRSGARVYTDTCGFPVADVLHVGDVFEHLTDLGQQIPKILKWIRPGGVLLAQGPLEANANLFLYGLRLARSVKRNRPSAIAPYHVTLATAMGQRIMFRRFGLEEIAFDMSEAFWPAPPRLFLTDLFKPRAVGLFVLRQISRLASCLAPHRLGNRYFYVGRRRFSS